MSDRLQLIREAVAKMAGHSSLEDAYADRAWLLNEYDNLAFRLDAIKKEVSGDWGINPTMAIERIQALLGMAPPACQHLYNFKSPNKCILCGDDPEPK